MSRKYYQAQDGEWIEVKKRGHRDMCCDCRLVHKINYKVEDGRVLVQSFRDDRATAAARRKIKTVEKDSA